MHIFYIVTLILYYSQSGFGIIFAVFRNSYTVKPEIKTAINFNVSMNISLGILVLSPSHAYNTFLLASIYFGEIISCTKFTKINGKPIIQALQYVLYLVEKQSSF